MDQVLPYGSLLEICVKNAAGNELILISRVISYVKDPKDGQEQWELERTAVTVLDEDEIIWAALVSLRGKVSIGLLIRGEEEEPYYTDLLVKSCRVVSGFPVPSFGEN